MPSLYEISVPVLIKNLHGLSKIMEKGSAHKEVSNEQLVNSCLIADMKNFIFQVQRVSENCKSVAEHLGKVDVSVLELKEDKTMEELQERLTKTIQLLESVKETSFPGEDEEICFSVHGHELKFTAKAFVLDWITPNFYFHFVTAYALLRKEGVQIGKRDFLQM